MTEFERAPLTLREALARYRRAKEVMPLVRTELERRLTARRRTSHPWLLVNLRIRGLLARRRRDGGSDVLDDLVIGLKRQRDAIARAGWFS